jgi:hypothetical protein
MKTKSCSTTLCNYEDNQENAEGNSFEEDDDASHTSKVAFNALVTMNLIHEKSDTNNEDLDKSDTEIASKEKIMKEYKLIYSK